MNAQNLASRSQISGFKHESSHYLDSSCGLLWLPSVEGFNSLPLWQIFFSISVLNVLEYDLIFVRLILDHCALDYVICQDVLLKEKQAFSTASHITEFSSQIPNACTDFVSVEGDKKWYLPLLCPVWSVRAGQFAAADWFSMARL